MTGAYKTTVRYVPDGGGVRIEYRSALPPAARHFVIHDVDAMQAATAEDITVLLHWRILKHVTPGQFISGAKWFPDYVWPSPAVPPGVVVNPAPVAEQAAFVSAVQAVKAATNKNIAKHYLTHVRAREMDDPVVRAVEWLTDMVARAEELA